MSDFENECDDEQLDEATLALAEEVAADESRTAIISPKRMKHMQLAYRIIKNTISDSDIKILNKIHEPYQSLGSISAVGNDIIIHDVESFVKAAKLASNIEVYSKNDRTVCMTLTFHGLTVPIE